MTKHKEKEEDIIEKKDMEKDLASEISQSDEGIISQGEELSEMKKLEKRAQDYLDGWKRTQADFENYKKQQAENQKGFAKFANLNLIMQILPVLDNFYAATEHIPEDQKNNPWVVGIMYIQKQLEQVLKDNGVEEMGVREGDEFDPNIHEAVQKDTKETDIDTKKTNIIKKVVSNGYKIDGKVIRAARVIVE